jgi:hypothetical protein
LAIPPASRYRPMPPGSKEVLTFFIPLAFHFTNFYFIF